jgi:hypothetical protein
MFEFLTPGFLYSLIKDAVAVVRGRHRRLSPSEIVELRQKWKPEFEKHILETRRQQLRKDVIIRDMKRLDDYPNIDEKSKRGISPWFRVGLMGIYHKGVQMGLSWSRLTEDSDGELRFTDYKNGEHGDINLILIGYVPFENIASVDWEGDEYYGFPHLYCYFDARRKEPYEKLAFCEERQLDHITYYTEVASYEAVRRRSRKRGFED